MSKVDQLEALIEKEILSITNLSLQLQKIQDQLDYHRDNLHYHQKQLELLQA
jgi:hypothetical protein